MTTPRPNASQGHTGSSSASGVAARPRGASVTRRRPRSMTYDIPLCGPITANPRCWEQRCLRGAIGIGWVDQHEIMVVHNAFRRARSHSPLSAKTMRRPDPA